MEILLVEDEPKIADVVKAYLVKEGYDVLVANTGTMALDMLKKKPSLIILDLFLPDIPGEEICSSIRALSDVPIIMLTAKSSEEDRVKGLGIGADDYVVKPFSPRELVARVKAVLRRSDSGDRAKIHSFDRGAILIDAGAHEVKVRGKIVAITPTELNILLTMAKNPNMVFSREKLINTCLGYGFEGYERTIDAHIKNLRQKIEVDPGKPEYIQTVYGVGYKFTGKRDES